jgi:diguanylate cyclase (GGDEF)-like protein
MQLKRFEAFIDQLSKDNRLGEFGQVTAVYRHTHGEWTTEEGEKISDVKLEPDLERVLGIGTHWRRKHDPIAYFPLKHIDCVVEVTCATPSRPATREKIQTILTEALKHSTHEFDAAHDSLTALLNSRSLESLLRRATTSATTSAGEGALDSLPTTTLIALDIDHFKQVNDSYGHDYGDLVLQCFASRLEKIVSNLEANSGGLELTTARMGGEEFAVVVRGAPSVDASRAIAERIRLVIADTVLPSDEEWEGLPTEQRARSLALPHMSERRITVSVGVSSPVSPLDSSEKAMHDLRREADAALYRAKSGGRNTVRLFPEIRDHFGTVLEHHADTDIVVIDIGSQVAVREGHEFFVYHPDFTGSRAYIASDGRSQKRLGTYPKVSSGRLVVFDVQPEVAFCRVAARSAQRFPPGSLLEFIPAGSIGHLIKSDAQIGPERQGLVAADRIQEFIRDTAETEQLSTIVFALNDIEALERSRGVVFINRALAALFEAIKAVMPRNAVISQLQSDTLALAARGKIEAAALALEVITNAGSQVEDGAGFRGGLFSTAVARLKEGDKSILVRTHALDYARYAALPAVASENSAVHSFTAYTADRVLYSQRLVGKVKEARRDYRTFKELGVDYFGIENQMALLEMVENNWDAAIEFLRRALALFPEYDTLKSNMAFAEFGRGRFEESYGLYLALAAEGIKLAPIHLPVYSLAAWGTLQTNPAGVEADEVVELLKDAISRGAFAEYVGTRREFVQAALEWLE